MKKRTRKRGPVPPKGGRMRITVNLPRALVPFVRSLDGSSLSKKIVGLVERSARDGCSGL